MIETISSAVAWVQFGLLSCLALLGLHRGWMVHLYLRHRRAAFAPPPLPAAGEGELPHVTVQLPIYNERNVAARLIEAAAALDYPRSRLQIQVLDDSTDDTVVIVQHTIARLRGSEAHAELRLEHVRRSDRTGFKAGALAHGLQTATGELVAVFDADFVPARQFLRETAPMFQADPRLGMVQARWEHLNPDTSQLTAVQAMLLDGHFVVEHVARSRSNCFFNFNGTAGIFRRTCVEDAGGWQHDTLTEDMDLSYRAQLRGWRFHYRPDLACPAELPIEMNAFLNQQHRWAKGSVQTGRKLLGRILGAPIPALAKGEAVFHLLGNVAFLLLLGLILIALPVQILRLLDDRPLPLLMAVVESAPLLLSTLCVLVYYGIAQHGLGRLRFGDLGRLPLLISIGAGMCINNSCAVIGAFSRTTGEFLRTPKHNVLRGQRVTPSAYRSRRGMLPYLELGLGLWASATATLALLLGYHWTAAFHALFALGLFWCGGACIAEDLRRRERLGPTPEPVSVPATGSS